MNLETIVARATPLAPLSQRRGDSTPTDMTTFRAERWAKTMGGLEALALRLRLDGLDTNEMHGLLRSSAPVSEFLPPWALVLERVGKRARTFSAFEGGLGLDRVAPLPFEHLVTPFVALARELSGDLSGLSENARASLDRALTRRLTFVGARTFLKEFRRIHPNPVDGDAHYRTFVTTTHQDGFEALFTSYPVLARLMSTIMLDSSAAAQELAGRIRSDLPILEATLGVGGVVEELEALLGDPHEHGRTVAKLRFARGPAVIYKPRSVFLDAAFGAFLDELRTHLPVPRVPTTLDQGTHGWVQFEPVASAQDASDVSTFYQRLGGGMALFHSLGTSDMHHENVLASGADPVLIDLETLVGPRVAGPVARDPDAGAEAMRVLDDSVLKSGLLPSLESMDGTVHDTSGIGGGTGTVKRLGYVEVNTDKMEIGMQEVPLDESTHRPKWQDRPVDGLDFEADILLGFERVYRWILAHSGRVQAFLASIRNANVRVVIRDTSIYGRLSRSSLEPELLHFGVDRGMAIDRLARGMLDRPELWRLVELESKCLERADIPRFWARVDGLELSSDDGAVDQALAESAYDRGVERLLRLSSKDLDRQVTLIRGAFLAAHATRARTSQTSSDSMEERGDLRAVASAVVRRFVDEAVRGRDGSATWIGLSFDHESGHYRLRPLGLALGDGGTGVALFLAAAARVLGDASAEDMARAALVEVRSRIARAPKELARELGLGGAVGVGSVVFGLAKIGSLLSDPTILEDARKLAHAIDLGALREDTRLDVISGGAGTLFGLLALASGESDPTFLELMQGIGSRLTERAISSPEGHGWVTIGKVPLTGFSHGASGIAVALARLDRHLGMDVSRPLIEGALAFERSTMDPTLGTWPDLRAGATGAPPVAWCHGAAGIGLARLELDGRYAGAREDLDRALLLVEHYAEGDSDLLCCGLGGRCELLLEASLRLGRPELRSLAEQRLAVVAARHTREQSFRLLSSTPSPALVPGLFQGAAGVGYQMLRALAPELVPSVLLFQ